MAQARTGLFRRYGKCAEKSHAINYIRLELVFRGADEKCAQNPNEISSLASELVFRDIPGKLVQRRGHSQWFGRGFGRCALLDPVGGCVLRVPSTPNRLGLLAAGALTFRLAAGLLPDADSRVRKEPPAADRARSLPGLWHGVPLWSPRRLSEGRVFRSKRLGHFWRVQVGRFS
jgi:hypothetical protein